jgi:predicted secreted hydrolase
MMRLPAAVVIVSSALICCADAAAPASDLDVIREDQAQGFTRAQEARVFSFPQDHGPHPDFRHEWWYVTGNLDAASGERFGFELTFFRLALAPPAATDPGIAAVEKSATSLSRWRTRQIYAAHFAITDVARGEFRFAQKYSRDALGLAGAQADPFRVWLDDWMLGVDSPDTRPWRLHARGQDYELTLDAQPPSQPVLNGEQGLSRKSDAAASYYYSIPRMPVHGRIVRAGRSFDVHGLAWLDREWGSGALAETQRGWDWFALQLADGSALMFYALRDHDGHRDPHSAGTWIDREGRAQPLSSDQVRIEVTDHWVSPDGARYPSRWRLQAPIVGVDVEVRPVLANQELGTRPRYWEGAVDITGTQGTARTEGRGYVELVGYGE